MRLLYQTHSPYARKVLVAAYEMGLQDELTVIHHETSPTRRNEAVFALNPLGKVPVLVCDDGTVLFDSNVICEYLDRDGRVIPADPQLRFRALTLQALAQGIADAGIAARWETERRPAHLRWPQMHAGQIEKIAAGCDFLEREIAARPAVAAPDVGSRASADTVSGVAGGARPAEATPPNAGGRAAGPQGGAPPPDIGDIALVTALSWIEFRAVYPFLDGRPHLAAWYRALCARPSMLATALEGQTQD
jgi:glutathione S-transferase